MKPHSLFLKAKIRIDKNPVGIVPGTMVNIKVDAFDELMIIWTSERKFTKDLVRSASPGEEAKYNERLDRLFVKCPGKSKEELIKKVAKNLGVLPHE